MELTYCEKFMQSITRIEGPHSVNILAPKENKTLPSILALGDSNLFSDFCDYCSNENGCLSLWSDSFLDSLHKFAIKEEIKIDIFLESEENFTDVPKRSVLSKFIYRINSLKEFYPNLRFHLIDVINNENKNGREKVGDSLIFDLCEHLEFGEIDDTETFITGVQKVAKEDDVLDLFKKILTVDSLKEYFNIPYIQKSSVIYNEFKQVSDPIKTAIYKNFSNLSTTKYVNETKQLIRLLDDFKANKQVVESEYEYLFGENVIPTTIINMCIERFAFLVSVLTISRIVVKKDIQFAVVLQESAHTRRFIQILTPEFYSIQSVYNEISPKCVQKDADATFAEITKKLYSEPPLQKYETNEETQWFERKNFLNQSPVELAFIYSNPMFIMQIVEYFSIENLLSFRSSAGSSIFSLAIENNLEAVLNLLIKKLVNNNITTLERGLVNKAIIHDAYGCLGMLLSLKYPPIEIIIIGQKRLNSLTFAIRTNNSTAVSLLCQHIKDKYILQEAKKENITNESVDVLDNYIEKTKINIFTK